MMPKTKRKAKCPLCSKVRVVDEEGLCLPCLFYEYKSLEEQLLDHPAWKGREKGEGR